MSRAARLVLESLQVYQGAADAATLDRFVESGAVQVLVQAYLP